MNPLDQIDALAQGLKDVPDLVFCFTPEGRYLFLNRTGEEFLGSKEEDIVGYHWSELGFSEHVMKPFTARVAQVAAENAPAWYQMESSPERGSRVLDVSLTPLKESPDAGVVAVLVIARDVTAYVHAE